MKSASICKDLDLGVRSTLLNVKKNHKSVSQKIIKYFVRLSFVNLTGEDEIFY